MWLSQEKKLLEIKAKKTKIMSNKNSIASGKEYYDMLIAKVQYRQLKRPFYKKLDVLMQNPTTEISRYRF